MKQEVSKYGEFENVQLSDLELERLQRRFGVEDTKLRIEALSVYMAAKRTKYKSHYAVILMWARRDASDRQPARSDFRLTETELKAQREKEHQRMFREKP